MIRALGTLEVLHFICCGRWASRPCIPELPGVSATPLQDHEQCWRRPSNCTNTSNRCGAMLCPSSWKTNCCGSAPSLRRRRPGSLLPSRMPWSGQAGLCQELPGHIGDGTMPAIHLVVQLAHLVIGELAGELGEGFA